MPLSSVKPTDLGVSVKTKSVSPSEAVGETQTTFLVAQETPTSLNSSTHLTTDGEPEVINAKIRILCVNDIYTTRPSMVSTEEIIRVSSLAVNIDQKYAASQQELNHVLQKDLIRERSKSHQLPSSLPLGGFESLRTIVDSLSADKETLFIINGDVLGGSQLASFFKGESLVGVLNSLQPTVLCIGNHEFDYGTQQFETCIDRSSFPWLGENIHNSDRSGLGLHNVGSCLVYDFYIDAKGTVLGKSRNTYLEMIVSLMLRRNCDDNDYKRFCVYLEDCLDKHNSGDSSLNDLRSLRARQSQQQEELRVRLLRDGGCGDVFVYRMGLYGVCTPNTPTLSYPSPSTVFSDPTALTPLLAGLLRAVGCDYVTLCSHLALHEDKTIAAHSRHLSTLTASPTHTQAQTPLLQGRPVNGCIDLILGGHEHVPIVTQCTNDDEDIQDGDESYKSEVNGMVMPPMQLTIRTPSSMQTTVTSTKVEYANVDYDPAHGPLIIKVGQNAQYVGVVDIDVVIDPRSAVACDDTVMTKSLCNRALDQDGMLVSADNTDVALKFDCDLLDTVAPTYAVNNATLRYLLHNNHIEPNPKHAMNAVIDNAGTSFDISVAEDKDACKYQGPLVWNNVLYSMTKFRALNVKRASCKSLISLRIVPNIRNDSLVQTVTVAGVDPAYVSDVLAVNYHAYKPTQDTVTMFEKKMYAFLSEDCDVDAPLCTLKGGLNTSTEHCRTRGGVSGCNLVADAIFAHGRGIFEHEAQQSRDYVAANNTTTFADPRDAEPVAYLSLINGGFIRGDAYYPTNTVLKVKDIMAELPFPKHSIFMRILGCDLLHSINQQLSLVPQPTGAFPHYSSNVRIVYTDVIGDTRVLNPCPPADGVLMSDEDRGTWEAGMANPVPLRVISLTVDGVPLQMDKVYVLSTSSFIGGGGDGCVSFLRGKKMDHPDKSKNNVKMSVETIQYLHALAHKAGFDEQEAVAFEFTPPKDVRITRG